MTTKSVVCAVAFAIASLKVRVSVCPSILTVLEVSTGPNVSYVDALVIALDTRVAASFPARSWIAALPKPFINEALGAVYPKVRVALTSKGADSVSTTVLPETDVPVTVGVIPVEALIVKAFASGVKFAETSSLKVSVT
jgi:hypothetical protein